MDSMKNGQKVSKNASLLNKMGQNAQFCSPQCPKMTNFDAFGQKMGKIGLNMGKIGL